ncbi:MAG: TonB-dependent receptor [Bacteroidaceae bacterium]|nr:TonB-dependent receptor [Bacteroidaceae bacterium]
MKRVLFLLAMLYGEVQLSIVHCQLSIDMDEIQVTAHRRLKDAGVQKTELDTTVLHDNIALSMSDILTQHSTLFIKSYGRATESTAEFRGTSPSHTQVLWNGMKINSPMLGTVDFSTIPANFVDQATLLHGASSLTLTGGGLGGAVEMKTLPLFGQGYALQYIQGIGSFGTYDQFLRFTYGNEHWSTSTRVVYSTSDNDFKYTNYDKKVDVRDASGNIIRSYHPTERNKSGYFDDVHALQDVYYRDNRGNRFGAMLWYTHSLRGMPFLSVDYREDTDFKNEHQQDGIRSTLSWDRTFDNWNIGARGGYVWQDIAYDYYTTRMGINTDITHSRSKSQQGYIQADADWMPRHNWLLTANLAVYYNHVRSSDKSPFHIGDNYNRGRMEYNLNLSAKYRPTERLSLSAVLREELYKRDFVPVIPALFAEYKILPSHSGERGLVLKASVARNYRYPTMDDLYFKPGGNPNLNPEKGITYDGGVEFYFKVKAFSLRGNLSVFDSYISDWILWTPNAKGYWQPSNLKKVHNYGTEMMLTAEVKMPHDWHLELSANYAYTPSINKSERVDDNDASYGKQLCYVPRHSANVSTRLSWRGWTLGYQWTFYSERFTTTSNEVAYITGRLKPYYMNNVSLEKQFQWKKVHASIKGVVNNLFDSEYVTVLSRPMAGRNFEIFLEVKPQWTKKVKNEK